MGRTIEPLTSDMAARLKAYGWPGNVRELQNVLERAVILCNEGGELDTVHLGMSASSATGMASATGASETMASSYSEHGPFPTLSELEKQHILAALKRSKGNRTHAAKMLSISIRTLRNKLNEYNFKGQTTAVPETEDAAA
jgi:two-component system response regulator FlrC